MNFSAPCIRRPVATTLLAAALLIAGLVAWRQLPVASLPHVDIPTVVIFAARPGAAPETMASSVTAPLERRLGTIAGVDEMSSVSSAGSAAIVVQFDIARDITGAVGDAQAAITAAAPDLPADMPGKPFLKQFNPADAPVMMLSLSSTSRAPGALYDLADSLVAQRLAQVDGVSQVQLHGAGEPAVRVRLNPAALQAAGLSGAEVDQAIRAANAIGPTGGLDGAEQASTLATSGQLTDAADYPGLVLKSAGGALVTLGQVASVVDATANRRLAAWNGRDPAILLTISKAADANVIATVDRIRAALPQLRAWLPPDVTMTVMFDRTASIRASIHDVGRTLLITAVLVLLIVLLFLRRIVPTLAAAASVPLSVAGTFVAMWAFGFSLDNFSLAALTISVGFVIDDAIVMIDAIVHHTERGRTPMQAALHGARQIGFTVLSISLSLVAVFIPLLFMGGIIGRLFHEFATTLSCAIVISALVSLTVTPMLCAHAMRHETAATFGGAWDRAAERLFAGCRDGYIVGLGWALRHRGLMIGATLAAAAATVFLYTIAPKALLPLQDTGLIEGRTIADPAISFAAMQDRQRRVVDILLHDPAVAMVGSQIGVSTGFDSRNRGGLTIALTPPETRVSAEQVIARLRPALAAVGGVQTVLTAAQDLSPGTREGGAVQFVLLGRDIGTLRDWTQRLEARLRGLPGIADVQSDQDRQAPTLDLAIDRGLAGRVGVTARDVDAALGTAFTQRQSAILYGERSQSHVVLEVDPAAQTDASALQRLHVGAGGVPLGSLVRTASGSAPLALRHQGGVPAATLSFNVLPGTSVDTALRLMTEAARDVRMPDGIHTAFSGGAKYLQESLASQPILIGAALLSIYIVLGVLYESLTQPLTILSTLPSAGLGALLALRITGTELSVVSIIGILLLMGIVKKNAIMLVDCALVQERLGDPPADAIAFACRQRFRPILMTSLAALFGALPLALSSGTGAELRQPLGIAVVGGLLVSQLLTLFTTPVIYLALQPARRRRTRTELSLVQPKRA